VSWRPGDPVRLETERLILRSLRPEDATERVLGWYRDPEIMAELYTGRTMTRGALRALIGTFDNATRFFLGIFDKEGGAPIGYFQIHGNRRHRYAYLTIVIGERDWQRKGLVAEARPVLRRLILEQSGFHRSVILVYPDKPAWVRSIESSGYRSEGLLRQHDATSDGGRRDVLVYGLLAEEARAREQAAAPTTDDSWRPGEPVRLETERLTLRTLTGADVSERMLGWYRDPEVTANLYRVGDMTRDALVAYLGSFDNVHRFFFGIFDTASGEQIGYFRVDGNPQHRHAFMTTVIGEKDFQARGVSGEARTAAFDFLFERAGIHRIIGTPYVGHRPSIRALQRLGLRSEGVLRQHDVGADGGRRSVDMHAILVDEWWALRAAGGP